ncbi:MAG: hypothetical protein H7039_18180 [Bryobacteraceae bacterium]|nr:hypothetical protein [Bryobacteraceae bacterium]
MNPRRLWTVVNQPVVAGILTVLSLIAYLTLRGGQQAADDHRLLHAEVESRLKDAKADYRTPGQSAAVRQDLAGLQALSVRHDSLVASSGISCPLDFEKASGPILDGLRQGSPEGASAARTGVDSLLSQLSGGGS